MQALYILCKIRVYGDCLVYTYNSLSSILNTLYKPHSESQRYSRITIPFNLSLSRINHQPPNNTLNHTQHKNYISLTINLLIKYLNKILQSDTINHQIKSNINSITLINNNQVRRRTNTCTVE